MHTLFKKKIEIVIKNWNYVNRKLELFCISCPADHRCYVNWNQFLFLDRKRVDRIILFGACWSGTFLNKLECYQIFSWQAAGGGLMEFLILISGWFQEHKFSLGDAGNLFCFRFLEHFEIFKNFSKFQKNLTFLFFWNFCEFFFWNLSVFFWVSEFFK